MDDDNLGQRIRYRLPELQTIYQLETVFVFDLETNSDQKLAEANAVGLYDVYEVCLKDRWDRGLTLDEIQTEKFLLFFINHVGILLRMIINKFLENYHGDERS